MSFDFFFYYVDVKNEVWIYILIFTEMILTLKISFFRKLSFSSHETVSYWRCDINYVSRFVQQNF